jgi:hypothetical protein
MYTFMQTDHVRLDLDLLLIIMGHHNKAPFSIFPDTIPANYINKETDYFARL